MPNARVVVIATSEFLTWKALGTFTGASTATVVVGNGFRYLLRKDVLWIPFAAAIGFAALQSEIVKANWHHVNTYFLIVLNGLLLFFTALGATQALVSVAHPQAVGQMKAQVRQKRRLFTPWL
jgi:hypothetical protein